MTKKAHGASLLEVLIAALVLAVGLLGIAGLQAHALKTNQSAEARSQATMLAYWILDAMRANRAAALAGAYNLSKTCSVPASGSTLAQKDQNYWLDKLQKRLGAAATTCGAIACTATGACTVTIEWDEAGAEASSSPKITTITLTSQL